MTRQVQICIPEDETERADRWGRAVDYDQRIGRLIREDSTLVNIDGETLQFPAGWIKPIIHN